MEKEKQHVWPVVIWQRETQLKELVPRATCGIMGQQDPRSKGSASQVSTASEGKSTDRQEQQFSEKAWPQKSKTKLQILKAVFQSNIFEEN